MVGICNTIKSETLQYLPHILDVSKAIDKIDHWLFKKENLTAYQDILLDGYISKNQRFILHY